MEITTKIMVELMTVSRKKIMLIKTVVFSKTVNHLENPNNITEFGV